MIRMVGVRASGRSKNEISNRFATGITSELQVVGIPTWAEVLLTSRTSTPCLVVHSVGHLKKRDANSGGYRQSGWLKNNFLVSDFLVSGRNKCLKSRHKVSHHIPCLFIPLSCQRETAPNNLSQTRPSPPFLSSVRTQGRQPKQPLLPPQKLVRVVVL